MKLGERDPNPLPYSAILTKEGQRSLYHPVECSEKIQKLNRLQRYTDINSHTHVRGECISPTVLPWLFYYTTFAGPAMLKEGNLIRTTSK